METTRDVDTTDALDRLEATAISADYADERQVQKDVAMVEAEIRRLRAELDDVFVKAGRVAAQMQMKLDRAEAELERRDAALREIAKGEGGMVTGAAVIANRALATGGDE